MKIITFAMVALAACTEDPFTPPDPTPSSDGPPTEKDGGLSRHDGTPTDAAVVDAEPDASLQGDWFVDAENGDDGQDGTTAQGAFRTITRALTVAASGDVVRVLPGRYDYDEARDEGEEFPLVVPSGVSLRGSESTRGRDVLIVGAGPAEGRNATVLLGEGAVLAGLTLGRTGGFPVGIHIVATSNIAIEDCTIAGLSTGILVENSNGNVFRNNVLRNNLVGILLGAASSARIESNVIHENDYGVMYRSDGGDLGGGESGSVGQNVLSCNANADLWVGPEVSVRVAANGCAWDHAPPTVSDIYNSNSAAIDLAGSVLAAEPCP